MSDSYRALCSDFYVNQKLSVKMELPKSRETVLDLFERVRKQFPAMTSFRRFRDELALESPQSDSPHRWMAVRGTSIRTGVVNPTEMPEAYTLHRQVLELAPFFLNISPLDVDFVELLFGFDLVAQGNHDAIVHDALVAGSPLGSLLSVPGASVIDCQPILGVALGQRGDLEAHFEVKTRAKNNEQPREQESGEPISIYLTLRKFGSVVDVKELVRIFDLLARRGEELVESRVVPNLLVPIRDAILSGNS